MCADVVAKSSFSVPLCFDPQVCVLKCFFAVYRRIVRTAFFFKNIKKESSGNQSGGSWGRSIAGCQKNQKTVPSKDEQDKTMKQIGWGGPTSGSARTTTERRDVRESVSSWPYQGSVQAKVARGHKKPCRVAIDECYIGVVRRNAFSEGHKSRCDGCQNSLGSGGFFSESFIHHLMVCTGKRRGEMSMCTLSTKITPNAA